MKALNIILPLLFLLLAGSCKAQSKTARHQEAAASAAPGKEDVLRVYEKQIRKYYKKLEDAGMDGVLAMSNHEKVKYTDIAIELISEALRRQGFKFVDSQTARNAIKKYYGVDITASNKALQREHFRRFIFKNGNPDERSEQTKLMTINPENGYPEFWKSIIFVPNYNYITTFPAINEVVCIKGLETMFEDDYDPNLISTGEIYYTEDWCKKLFYRNELVFHDSEAALNWLLKHDEDFLRGLFVGYGYNKSAAINRLMLDQITRNPNSLADRERCENIFASKRKDRKLPVHQELLQYVVNHVTN